MRGASWWQQTAFPRFDQTHVTFVCPRLVSNGGFRRQRGTGEILPALVSAPFELLVSKASWTSCDQGRMFLLDWSAYLAEGGVVPRRGRRPRC